MTDDTDPPDDADPSGSEGPNRRRPPKDDATDADTTGGASVEEYEDDTNAAADGANSDGLPAGDRSTTVDTADTNPTTDTRHSDDPESTVGSEVESTVEFDDGGGGTVESTVDAPSKESPTTEGAMTESELEREILDPEERGERPASTCHECGAEVNAEASVCPACGTEQRSRQVPTSAPEKNPGIAAVLSLLVAGLGQVYNGQFVRGLLWFVGAVVTVSVFGVFFFVLTVVTFGLGVFLFPLVLVLGFVINAVAAYDAYRQAERMTSSHD